MCWMWRKTTEVQIKGILVLLNRVCVCRRGRNVYVNGCTFRAVLYFNCFKKHINNTQATIPPPPTNKNDVHLKHTGSLEMPPVPAVPKGWTGNFPESLSDNPWLFVGSHFSSEGNTCGGGSCDNPLWPWLRCCVRAPAQRENFLLQSILISPGIK